jgi:hypothetical protein
MERVLLITLSILCAFGAAIGQCPTISVVGPPGLTLPGEKMVFRAEVGAMGTKLGYSWSIDKGTIVEGQNTPSITVQADRDLEGQILTATVQLNGVPNSCKSTASESAGLGRRHDWHWADSWELLKPNDIRGRLDVIFAELSNNPTDVGFIQLQVTHEEKFEPSNARLQFILKHAKYREFDKRRLWFSLELAEEPMTNFLRIKPEAEKKMPCNQCLIIKGEHL